jgi:hypothetical protein
LRYVYARRKSVFYCSSFLLPCMELAQPWRRIYRTDSTTPLPNHSLSTLLDNKVKTTQYVHNSQLPGHKSNTLHCTQQSVALMQCAARDTTIRDEGPVTPSRAHASTRPPRAFRKMAPVGAREPRASRGKRPPKTKRHGAYGFSFTPPRNPVGSLACLRFANRASIPAALARGQPDRTHADAGSPHDATR